MLAEGSAALQHAAEAAQQLALFGHTHPDLSSAAHGLRAAQEHAAALMYSIADALPAIAPVRCPYSMKTCMCFFFCMHVGPSITPPLDAYILSTLWHCWLTVLLCVNCH